MTRLNLILNKLYNLIFMNTKNLLFFLMAFVMFACSNQKMADKDSFVVKGAFLNANEAYLILEELTIDDRVLIDSVKIKSDGSFFFKVKPEQAGFYILKMHDFNFITLLAEKGENIVVNADAREIAATYDVEGSHGSQLIKEINTKLRANYARVDSLRDEFERSKYMDNFLDIKAELDSIYFEIIKDQKNYVITFIEENSSSLASLIALYQTFGQEPLLSEREDFVYFEKLAEGLMSAYPDNPHSIDLNNRVGEIRQFMAEKAEAEKRMQPGNIAPEIKMTTPDGNSLALSSLRGKYVLVNFWASWCAPCRQKNPQLVNLYNRFKNKNFEIFGVSLDRDRQSWLAAIELDKLTWPHVSDLGYWQSPVVKLYNIESIPASYLIDKEGLILYKNPEIEELNVILRELL